MSKKALTKYKLTTQEMTTHHGFQWKVGQLRRITKPGNNLCSDEVFHYYDSPELAALLNPIHANIDKPRLWRIACNSVVHDGLKGGSKWQRLEVEIPLPQYTTTQRVAFGILCALQVYHDPQFCQWATDWLNGKDRSANAANAAAYAAYATANAAAYAAAYAANAAAYAAYATANAAAYAAAYAANAAAYAAYAAYATANRVDFHKLAVEALNY